MTVSALLPVVVIGGWLTFRTDSQSAPPAKGAVVTPTAAATESPLRLPPAHVVERVAALGQPITPLLFVHTTKPVTNAQITALLRRTHGDALLVSTGKVDLGQGTTLAVGVDPSSFRAYTPRETATSNPLWDAVARGDIAVAHTVATALAVDLGQHTDVAAPATKAYDLRVGALATSGLPGVGVVVDNSYDSVLDLVPRTGVILSSTDDDPEHFVAAAKQELAGASNVEVTSMVVASDKQPSWSAPAVGPITSPFGPREAPEPGASTFHEGIDIGAPLGAPIWAAGKGVVSYAGAAAGFGNEVIISHPDGVQTVYGHMEKILVATGEVVRSGQEIALVGSEGESTGAHLHFEVHVNDSPVDPIPWLKAHGIAGG